jgi:hypothetical protein
VTFAHQGAAAYREEFDLLYRRKATHSNAMWQADHCKLPKLYSRIGFNHEMVPLSDDETRFFLDQRWGHWVSAHSNDFTG